MINEKDLVRGGYSSFGIVKMKPMDSSPAGNESIVYNPAQRPSQPGAFLPGQAISDLTFMSGYSQRRIRISMNPGDNPGTSPGSMTIVNEQGNIIWAAGDEQFFTIQYVAPYEDVAAYTAFDAFAHNSNLFNLTIGNPGATGDIIASTNSGSGDGFKIEVMGGWTLHLTDNDPIGGIFQKIVKFNFGTNFLVLSDGTDPNGLLTATQGDVCFNSAGGAIAYCTGGSTWVNL